MNMFYWILVIIWAIAMVSMWIWLKVDKINKSSNSNTSNNNTANNVNSEDCEYDSTWRNANSETKEKAIKWKSHPMFGTMRRACIAYIDKAITDASQNPSTESRSIYIKYDDCAGLIAGSETLYPLGKNNGYEPLDYAQREGLMLALESTVRKHYERKLGSELRKPYEPRLGGALVIKMLSSEDKDAIFDRYYNRMIAVEVLPQKKLRSIEV